MNIKAVVICDQYDDLLARTLRENKYHFQHLVVVTSAEDLRTQRVCEERGIDCVPTDILGTRWGEFCKGKGINVGLDRLREKGPVDWVCQLDADIALPPLFGNILDREHLQADSVYGCDRHMLMAQDWEKHLDQPRLQHENGVYLHTNAYPLGTRIVVEDGWLPIGFFQLWNPDASQVHDYPELHNGAGRTDMQFAREWPPERRRMLGSLVVYHIETEPAPQGANWDGRTTVRWGEAPQAAAVNAMPRKHRPHRPAHHHHHHHHRHYDSPVEP